MTTSAAARCGEMLSSGQIYRLADAATRAIHGDDYRIATRLVIERAIREALAAPSLTAEGDPPAPTLVCPKCGADRFKEDCRSGNRIDCPMIGTAQSAPIAPAESGGTPESDALTLDILDARYGRPLVAALDMCKTLEAIAYHAERRLAAALARVEVVEKALRRIERWHGEFPPTGLTWDDGTAMSYSTAFGSNGERDYMRDVARTALSTTNPAEG